MMIRWAALQRRDVRGIVSMPERESVHDFLLLHPPGSFSAHLGCDSGKFPSRRQLRKAQQFKDLPLPRASGRPAQIAWREIAANAFADVRKMGLGLNRSG